MESLNVNFNEIIYPLSNQKSIPSNNIPPNGIYCIDNKCTSPKIIKKDLNTYLLKESPFCNNCCYSSIIIFTIILLIGTSILGSFLILNSDVQFRTTEEIYATAIYILVHSLFIIGTIYSIISCKDYLILRSNSITKINKVLCCKMKTVYNFGELQRAEIDYVSENNKGILKQYYKFNLIITSEKKDCFFKLDGHKKIVDFKYFKDFIDIINEHIENNML